MDIHDVQGCIVLDGFDRPEARRAGQEVEAAFLAAHSDHDHWRAEAVKRGRRARMAWALRHTTLDEAEHDSAAAAGVEAMPAAVRAFVEWLASLDDDDPNSPGRRDRRTVTLQQITDRAAALL